MSTARGKTIWVAFTATTRRSERGSAARLAGSLRDISSRKHAEQELRDQVDLVRSQRDAIRSLSAPVLQVQPKVLVLPVIGRVDAERAEEIGTRLLAVVERSASRYVVFDVTGIESIDAACLDRLLRVTRACELLGVRAFVCGVRPKVASAIVAEKLEIGGLRTFKDLHQALEHIATNRRGA